MDQNSPDLSLKTHKREATRVTLIGAALDGTLGLLKIVAGTLAGSVALVSDGIHSLSDLVTDAFVLLMARIAGEGPDREHPYGHRRFETLGTIIIGTGLFVVAGLICYDSLRRLGEENLQVPGITALLAAGVSIAGKEWIFRYTRTVARRIGSDMLMANAWHSRTDALSSIAVLLGVGGAMAGFPWMDLVAAVAVGLMIGRIAWQLLASSLSELVDTAAPPEQAEPIRAHILEHTGIKGVHDMRSRRHGGRIMLDIHIQVDNKISVSEGHYLADRIIMSLKQRFPEVADAIIHIDPELDAGRDAPLLPLRQEVTAILLDRWKDLLSPQAIESFNLHYLERHIEVEVYLKDPIRDNSLRTELKARSSDLPWLDRLTFYARC